MYKLKADINANPLLKYAKQYIFQLPRKARIAFFCKYIVHAIHNRDKTVIMEGLDKLLGMYPDLQYAWRIALKTYDKDEGNRVDLLFKHAFGNTNQKKVTK